MTPDLRRRAPAALLLLSIAFTTALPAEPAAGPAPGPVQQQLDQLREESDRSVPPEVLEAGRKGTEELRRSGLLEGALQVGDRMPAFRLADGRGTTVTSDELLARGPMVLVFYRGAWCPFCNLYLRSLQQYLPEFEARGASLVAISGDTPDRTLTVEKRNELGFTVLTDPGFEVARRFRIVYEMPKVTNDAILKLGFDLTRYYGTERPELPLSATYVIDRGGKVVYAFLEADYKKRAEPTEILEALPTAP